MLAFQQVEITDPISRDDPLYVGNFYDLQGMWWSNRKKRQSMIFSVAFAWYQLVKNRPTCPGLLTEEIALSRLTREVRDARIILDRFFEVTKLGYNRGNDQKSLTHVSPRKLDSAFVRSITKHLKIAAFDPGLPPSDNLAKARVPILMHNAALIRTKLHYAEREDLLPAIDWIFKQGPELLFYFKPCGRLQLRDTSVWPIRAIETWPGWLRADLFGITVDLEVAFVQFILWHLEKKHKGRESQMQMKYPDIIKSAYDKHAFREELCSTVLKIPADDFGIDAVKELIMALANGSNVSPQMMVANNCRSQAVDIVKKHASSSKTADLLEIGKRLQSIAKQFRAAKRELCLILLNQQPSRSAQKQIFGKYFEWEREARYKIWEMTNFTGISAHDGLDGVILDNPQTFAAEVFECTGLRVRVGNFEHSLECPISLMADLQSPSTMSAV